MRKLLNPFALLFTLILSIVSLYIGMRLARGPVEWGVLILAAFLLWLLPTVHWASEADRSSRAELLLQQASFISMGLMSWLFVLAIARDLGLGLAYLFAGGASAARLSAISEGAPTLFFAGALTAFGGWRAFRGPRVREVEIPIAGLPEPLEGLRIAQITDLHAGPTIGRGYIEGVVEKVASLRPDLTVLTGDIVDGNLLDLRESLEPMTRLTPRGKVFYVPGNHEYYWDIDSWIREFSDLGATVLMNQGVEVFHNGARLWIGGVTDPAARGHGSTGPDIAQAARGGESAEFRLLLSHRPDPVPEAEAAGFQLQLSGHTHGGQFFPWTWVVRFFHRHSLGLHRHERLWVYVSPGTGSWGPPVRIGTTPEVTCLRLVKG